MSNRKSKKSSPKKEKNKKTKKEPTMKEIMEANRLKNRPMSEILEECGAAYGGYNRYSSRY